MRWAFGGSEGYRFSQSIHITDPNLILTLILNLCTRGVYHRDLYEKIYNFIIDNRS